MRGPVRSQLAGVSGGKPRSRQGFTLIELVMVMAVFSVVIVIVGHAFSTLLRYSAKFTKSEESNIEGNIGLELLRHDVATAGYGLPVSFIDTAITYNEAGSSPSSDFNDAATASKVPRAVAGSSDIGTGITITGNDGVSYLLPDHSEYLALKGTALGTQSVALTQQPTAQKWTYATFNNVTASKVAKSWPTASANFSAGEQVVVLTRSAAGATPGYQLLNSGSQFATSYPADGKLHFPFNPRTVLDTAYVYGLAPGGAGSSAVRMPFNRTDYLIAKPQSANLLPAYCAPNTGILYRAILHNSSDAVGGKLDFQPVLDCVASMHVVLGWSTTGSGTIDSWTNVDGTSTNGTAVTVTDPGTMTRELKVVKVYILAQDGRMDPDYTVPADKRTISLYTAPPEEGSTVGKSYTLSSDAANNNDMTHYRWKVYKLVVRPKNLSSNQ